jgi:hypothetical protein
MHTMHAMHEFREQREPRNQRRLLFAAMEPLMRSASSTNCLTVGASLPLR